MTKAQLRIVELRTEIEHVRGILQKVGELEKAKSNLCVLRAEERELEEKLASEIVKASY